MVTVKTEAGKIKGCRWGHRRGALLETFDSYARLQARVKDIARNIGISERRAWDDLFDWNQTG